MGKDVRTNVIISTETKGFDKAQQQVTKFNTEAAKGLKDQTKGFSEAQKTSEQFEKALGRLEKTFEGTSGAFKKNIEGVMSEFDNLNQMEFKDVQKHVGGLKEHLGGLAKEQAAITAAMGKMEDKGSPAYKKLKEHLKGVTEESKNTERQIVSLERAFAKQAAEAKKAAEEQKRLSADAAADARMRRGAFVQGLAQGGLPMPSPFLQRGPGMGRQLAGMGIGRALTGGMGVTRGVGGAMFGGVAGVQAMLSGIPMVGGLMAGQLGAAQSYAQQQIAFQQTKLEIAPYLGSVAEMQEVAAEKAEARARRRKSRRRKKLLKAEWHKNLEQRIGEMNLTEQEAKYFRMTEEVGLARAEGDTARVKELQAEYDREMMTGAVGAVADLLRTPGVQAPSRAEAEDARWRAMGLEFDEYDAPKARDTGRGWKPWQAGVSQVFAEWDKAKADPNYQRRLVGLMGAERDRQRQAGVAIRRARMGGTVGLGREGVAYMGAAMPETYKFAAGVVQAGGGRMREAREEGILTKAMAAKTVYGIQGDVAGAFLGGARRGGLLGAEGGAGEAFKSAIADGLSLGLEGSELVRYMQEMAQGINQFTQTGIGLNPGAIAQLGDEISDSGVTGTRAVTMARGMVQYAQTMGQRGIQGGVDLMMLRDIGGYTGEGGGTAYRDAIIRMEQLQDDLRGKNISEIDTQSPFAQHFRNLLQAFGGGPGVQDPMLHARLQQMGVQTSMAESAKFAAEIRGTGDLMPGQLDDIKREMRRKALGRGEAALTTGAQGLEKSARDVLQTVGPNLKTQARLQNQQIKAGAGTVGAIQSLEQSTLSVSTAFLKLTRGPLNAFTKGLEGATTVAVKAMEQLGKGDLAGATTTVATGAVGAIITGDEG